MNKASLIMGIVVFVVLTTAILLVGRYFNRSASVSDTVPPVSSGSSDSRVASAQEVANEFVGRYMAAETDWSLDPAISQELKLQMEAETVDFDSGMTDPIFCTDDLPTSFNVEMMPTNDETAVAEVAYTYETGVVPVTMVLDQSAGAWQITDILCGSEERLDSEFIQ